MHFLGYNSSYMIHGRPLKIFFSGIGGSGLSAIANFMADKGHVIVGSDREFDAAPCHPSKTAFQSRGITIVRQNGNGIDDTFDLAVFSTAVEPDRPDFKKAVSLGIPVKTRPDYLSEIASSFNTIAVSGTSGKSTVSGMLAFLMSRLGLKPNFIGGGRVKQFKSAVSRGNSLTGDSDFLVIEACESDGTIVNYRPQYSVILNLALDHHSVDKTAKMFETLMKNTAKKVFINADDKNLRSLTGGNPVTFSMQNPSHYAADNMVYEPFSTHFSVHGTRFRLSLPGKYNLYNALSCIAFLSETGVSMKEIAEVMPEFQGVERRFDIHLNERKMLIIDDYAHNPHKIASLMETVKHLREDVCYIFQPHGFGPTRMMKKEYIETFIENLRASDHLILLPIYYAGGTAGKDISSHELASGIRAGRKSVEVIEEREDIIRKIHTYRNYVIFGARDETLSDFAKEMANTIRAQKI